jgi:hypothetical protein
VTRLRKAALLTDWILVFVRVDSGVKDVAEKVVHDVCQSLCVHHAVQRTHEDRLLRVQALGWLLDEVAVSQNPWNHLHLNAIAYIKNACIQGAYLFGTHAATRHFVVVFSAVAEVVGAGLQERLHGLVGLEEHVDVASCK